MKRDSLAYALSGVLFGLLVGWIIGSQQGTTSVSTSTVPQQAAAPASAGSGSAAPQPPPFDAARVADLERQAGSDPKNAAVRIELGNLYFDGERYDQAIKWYEAALALDEKNVNVSTDLAVAYYYSNQADRALAQIDYSLKLDPKHLKTLLNRGIIRAFGKQDLAGAQESWEQVVALAPTSEEGRRAQQGLEGLRSAHANTAAGAAAGSGTRP